MRPYYADESVTLHHGKCEDILPSLPANSVDAIVTDPPAAVRFMGREWDSDLGGRRQWVAWLTGCMEAAARVLKPGGHLLVWALPRTSGWTQWALEDAGLEVRDCIVHLFGCLSDDTEILVSGRWEPYRNVASGSLALAYNSERDEFAWEPVQEVYIYPGYSDTAYRIRGDHTDQLVTREHRCLVERGGTYAFERAEEAARQREARVPVLEDLPGLLAALPLPDQGTGGAEPDLLVPLPQPVDLRAAQDEEAEAAVRLVPAGVHAQEQQVTGQSALLLPGTRSEIEGSRPGICGQDARHRGHGAGGLDRCQHGVLRAEDDRRGEPGMERRGHLLSQERELSAGQVRPVPAGVRGDGPQGRLRDGTPALGGPGDRPVPAPGGSGPPRQPRPARQRPAEPDVVREQPGSQAVRASRFTRSDLARVEPVEYSGLVWCVRVPSGAFVARRNGKVFVTGNSGFPKSLDVSKAIDRRRDDTTDIDRVRAWLDAERRKAGLTLGQINDHFGHASNGGGSASSWTTNPTSRALPTWEQWERLRGLIGFGDEMDVEVWRLNGRKGTPGEAWGQREVIGSAIRGPAGFSAEQVPRPWKANIGQEYDITAPATEDAARWEGWGTALKPGQEMWWLARKPLAAGSVAANVLEWGTGALNIARCRVDSPGPHGTRGRNKFDGFSDKHDVYGDGLNRKAPENPDGRWPTNLVLTHDARCEPAGTWRVRGSSRADRARDTNGIPSTSLEGGVDGSLNRVQSPGYADADGLEEVTVWSCVDSCPVAELDRQSGVLTSGTGAVKRASAKGGARSASIGAESRAEGTPMLCYGDTGGASRFYPVFKYQAKAPASERPRLDDGSAHECVKPLELARWMCRLVTPPGGTVLDMFCGSGVIGEAAIVEGFRAVLIDQDLKSVELTKVRLSKPIQPTLFGGVA